MPILFHKFKYTFKSNLKKYEKLNGYSAQSYNVYSFLTHCSMKFRNSKNERLFSEYTLNQDMKRNKLWVQVELAERPHLTKVDQEREATDEPK